MTKHLNKLIMKYEYTPNGSGTIYDDAGAIWIGVFKDLFLVQESIPLSVC